MKEELLKNKILLAALLFTALIFALGCGDDPKPTDNNVVVKSPVATCPA